MLIQLVLCGVGVSAALFLIGLAMGGAAFLMHRPRLDQSSIWLARMSGKLLGVTTGSALVWSAFSLVA